MSTNAGMAEWSKAVDLSPTISGCVGSTPTLCNSSLFNKILLTLLTLIY